MDDFENIYAIEKVADYSVDRRSMVLGSGLLATALAFGMLLPEQAHATVPDGITFTVPGTLNYKIRGDGTLIGPSSEALRIVNTTDGVEIRVTGVKATQGSGFTLVSDATSSQATNALEFEIGPHGDQINLASATGASGASVGDELAWTMAAPDVNEDLSYIQLESSGRIANYNANALRTNTQGATLEWYLANDTLTDEILERTKEFEDTNAEISDDVDDLYALLTANHALPREVYVQAPVNNSITVDTTPALWHNTSDGQLYLVTD